MLIKIHESLLMRGHNSGSTTRHGWLWDSRRRRSLLGHAGASLFAGPDLVLWDSRSSFSQNHRQILNFILLPGRHFLRKIGALNQQACLRGRESDGVAPAGAGKGDESWHCSEMDDGREGWMRAQFNAIQRNDLMSTFFSHFLRSYKPVGPCHDRLVINFTERPRPCRTGGSAGRS